MKFLWKTLLISSLLTAWWPWKEVSAQDYASMHNSSKSITLATKNDMHDTLKIQDAILEAFDDEYNKFIKSEQWLQFIQLYDAKQFIDKSISDKGEILKNIKDSIVEEKICNTVKYIFKDMENRPDYYRGLNSNNETILIIDNLYREIDQKLKYEFKDYLSTTLPPTEFEYIITRFSSGLLLWLILSIMTVFPFMYNLILISHIFKFLSNTLKRKDFESLRNMLKRKND